MFGPPNYIITKNSIDNYWYNRIPYYTFEPKKIYYITYIKYILNQQDTMKTNTTINISGGIFTYTPPEIIPITLAQGTACIGGNKVILNE